LGFRSSRGGCLCVGPFCACQIAFGSGRLWGRVRSVERPRAAGVRLLRGHDAYGKRVLNGEVALAAAGPRSARPPRVRPSDLSRGASTTGRDVGRVVIRCIPGGRRKRPTRNSLGASRWPVYAVRGGRMCTLSTPAVLPFAEGVGRRRELVVPPTYGGCHGARHPCPRRPFRGHQ
jgi:hypothetical protein